MGRSASHERPALLVAPSGADARILSRLIEGAGIPVRVLPDVAALMEQIGEETGAVVVAEEALQAEATRRLVAILETQPEWSDLPLVILTTGGAAGRNRWTTDLAHAGIRHAMVLERPFRGPTLLAAVRTALQSRRRQHQVRDELERRWAAERALRESEGRLRAAADELDRLYRTAPIGLALLDRELRFLRVNEHLAEMNGLPVSAHVGRTVREILPDLVEVAAEHMARVVETRAPVTWELEAETPARPGDPRIWTEVWSPLVDEDGSVYAANIVVKDVTDRRRAEETLRRWNETLEQSVADRTAVLQAQRATLRRLALELGEAEQRERRRLAELLHGGIQQMLVAVRMQLARIADAERSDDEPLLKAMTIVDETIAAARSLSHELAVPVDLELTVNEDLESVAHWSEEKHGLRVRIDAPEAAPEVPAPIRMFLGQCLRELLLNVVKHAGCGEARITLREDADAIRVEVADTGGGFDPRPAEQPDGGSGAGLGLFGIRERIQALGGSLEVETAPGAGTRVRIALPRGAARART